MAPVPLWLLLRPEKRNVETVRRARPPHPHTVTHLTAYLSYPLAEIKHGNGSLGKSIRATDEATCYFRARETTDRERDKIKDGLGLL